ncbi:hypothetical protein YC2023_093155 [Brassica napus]
MPFGVETNFGNHTIKCRDHLENVTWPFWSTALAETTFTLNFLSSNSLTISSLLLDSSSRGITAPGLSSIEGQAATVTRTMACEKPWMAIVSCNT